MHQPSKRSERIGDFVLTDEMTGGGNARIFRVRFAPEGAPDMSLRLSLNDAAILKVLRDSAVRDSFQLNAFSREAELIAMIEHPNVVRGLTRGMSGGRMWTAMEYVEGTDLYTLRRLLDEKRLRMRPELVCSLASDLLSALSAAHALTDARGRGLGLIHRDVTPKNVMIDVHGNGKLLDFGSALLSVREEPAAVVIGTPGYLAPEQARLEPLTPSVDLYAVGVLMFELLTGTRLFPVEGYTDKAVLDAHARNKKAAWPRGLDVPLELRAVIDKALGDAPEDRPRDASTMFAMVDALLDDPTEAKRRLALLAKDIAWSDPERPAPLFA